MPDGFLVPTHKTGGINVIKLDINNNPIDKFKITVDK